MGKRQKIGVAALGLAAMLAVAGIPQRVIAEGLMYFGISEMPGDVTGEKEAFQGIATITFFSGQTDIYKDTTFYLAEEPGVYTIENVCVEVSATAKHIPYCKILTTLDGPFNVMTHTMALTRAGTFKANSGETIVRYTATHPVKIRSNQPPKLRFERWMWKATAPSDLEDSAEMRVVISGYRTTPAILIDPPPPPVEEGGTRS